MHRRTVLTIGVFSSLGLLVGGAAVVRSVPPVWVDGKLNTPAAEVVWAVAKVVLEGQWVEHDAGKRRATHIEAFEAVMQGFPEHVQQELSQLFRVLAHSMGRRAIADLSVDWPQASMNELQHALRTMRMSSWSLRQQAYHALRDLTNAAHYADERTWSLTGYPGPRSL